jgi:hypothetical protein
MPVRKTVVVVLSALLNAGMAPDSASQLSIEVPASVEQLQGLHLEIWQSQNATPNTVIPTVAPSRDTKASLVTVPADCDATRRLVLYTATMVSEAFVPMGPACKNKPFRPRMFRSATVRGIVEREGLWPAMRADLAVTRCQDRAVGAPAKTLTHYPLTMASDGRWEARIPGECLDLKLSLRNHAPLEWTDLVIRPMASVGLGIRFAKPSASVRTKVRDGAGTPARGTPVYAVPAREWDEAIDRILTSKGMNDNTPVATADDAGNVLFEGLPAGLIRLVAASSGGAVGISEPQLLSPGQEHNVPTLSVPKPAMMTIQVRSAGIAQRDRRLEAVARPLFGGFPGGRTGVPGITSGAEVKWAALFQGDWRVTLIDVESSGQGRIIAERDVQLYGGELVVPIFLSAEEFTGELLAADGRPIEGFVELMDSSGRQSSRHSANTGKEGIFRLTLPAFGEYDVFAYSLDRKALGVALSVSFQNTSQVTSVTLPNGAVSGVVVDSEDKPVAGAIVALEYRGRPALGGLMVQQFETGPDGRFSATGLVDGVWSVEAFEMFRASGPELLTVATGTPTRLRMRLKEATDLAVTVWNYDGNRAPGVEGVVYFENPTAPQLARVERFRTDATGQFVLRLPIPRPPYLNIQIYQRERGISAHRVPVADTVEIRLPPSTGGVVLNYGPLNSDERPPLDLLVTDNGAMVSLDLARSRSQSVGIVRGRSGSVIEVNFLAPGRWRLIRLPAGDAVPWFLYGSDQYQVVSEFVVHQGAVQFVDLR